MKYLKSIIEILFAGGVLLAYMSGFVADPKSNNISEKRKNFSNFMFYLGNIMIWSPIIIGIVFFLTK